jgi:hypothetical protein
MTVHFVPPETPLTALAFSVREKNLFSNNNLATVGDLVTKIEEVGLKNLRNPRGSGQRLGPSNRLHVFEILDQVGYYIL